MSPKQVKKKRIQVGDGMLPSATLATCQALAKHTGVNDLFHHAGGLVTVVPRNETVVINGHEFTRQTLSFQRHTPASIRLLASERAIYFRKRKDSRKQEVIKDCPLDVARTCIESGRINVPMIRGIRTAPTIRADGSILQEKGYDEESQLYYWPNEPFPRIGETPSRDDAIANLNFLRAPFAQFPFANPHDESAFLAAILTAICRPAFCTAPLFAFSGNAFGCGKTLLARAIALLLLGDEPGVMTMADKEEENRKRILGSLMASEEVVLLDNLLDPLESESLYAALSAPSFKDRPIYEKLPVKVPTSCTTWLATGCNLVIPADGVRRVILIELLTDEEFPEDRSDFEFPDLVSLILKNRPMFVRAALTIIRSYVTAGFPDSESLGGFEDWSRHVRSALIWLGMPDPRLGREKLRAADPTKNDLEVVMSAFRETFNQTEVSAKDCVKRAQDEPTGPFCNALNLVFGEIPSTRSLGKYLSRHEHRVVRGYCFVSRSKGGGIKGWRVTESTRNILERLHAAEE